MPVPGDSQYRPFTEPPSAKTPQHRTDGLAAFQTPKLLQSAGVNCFFKKSLKHNSHRNPKCCFLLSLRVWVWKQFYSYFTPVNQSDFWRLECALDVILQENLRITTRPLMHPSVLYSTQLSLVATCCSINNLNTLSQPTPRNHIKTFTPNWVHQKRIV